MKAKDKHTEYEAKHLFPKHQRRNLLHSLISLVESERGALVV